MLLRYELFKLRWCDFRCLQKNNFSLTQINDVLLKCIGKNLVVAILRSFRETEKQSLSDVILSEKVRTIIQKLLSICNWVLRGKELSRQWFELISLWWVYKLRYEDALFRFVISKPSKELIFVYECQLCASWIHVHLMDKHIGHLTVFYHRNAHDNESNEHSWEHCWI